MSTLSALAPPISRHPGFNRALHPDRIWIRAPRLVVGVAVLVALVQKTYDAMLPASEVDVGQLYSEFTVQSNLVFGLVLIASAAVPRARLPHWWDHVFGALVFYVYDFLDPTLDGGWSQVLAMTARVLVAFLVVAVLVHFAGNGRVALAAPRERKRTERRERQRTEQPTG